MVSADGTAAEQIRFLKKMNDQNVQVDNSGRPYNEQRRQLPGGTTVVSNQVPVELQRVTPNVDTAPGT